jgi:hypothetical protein
MEMRDEKNFGSITKTKGRERYVNLTIIEDIAGKQIQEAESVIRSIGIIASYAWHEE